ncbi:MAG: cysteine hydrolase family protein [Acidobacteriota bacterium]
MSTVFFDIDTQADFLFPGGALYVPGAEAIVENVATLNRYAASQGIPVVSTMDAHAPNDPEFAQYPPHCIVGTPGQRKPGATLLHEGRQIILEKQTTDCFSNPDLPGLLQELNADRAVVYGVVTEICVKNATLGLLRHGLRVEVVMDAVRSLNETDAAAFVTEFTAAGGTLTTVDRVQVELFEA